MLTKLGRAQTGIKVKVEDGVVILTGQVKSLEEKQKAEEVARAIPGVVQVQSDLQVAVSRQR